jgi:hypothetical protein
MPLYDFMNEETGEVEERIVSISGFDQFLKDNPHLKQVHINAPALNQGGLGDRVKNDGGFKEVLSKISDANPNSKLANTYGKKDKKSVAVREAVQNVQKRMGDISTKNAKDN